MLLIATIFLCQTAHGIKGGVALNNAKKSTNWCFMASSKRCSGIVLDPRHLLTAASCLEPVHRSEPRTLVWRVGNTAYNSGTLFKSLYIKVVSELEDADLALITLAHGVPVRDGTKHCFIDLPDEADCAADTEGVVAGWGKTDTKETADALNFLDTAKISKAAACEGKTQEGQLCVTYKDDTGHCEGDQGGPLVATLKGTRKALAIMSKPSESCTKYGMAADLCQWAPKINELYDKTVTSPPAQKTDDPIPTTIDLKQEVRNNVGTSAETLGTVIASVVVLAICALLGLLVFVFRKSIFGDKSPAPKAGVATPAPAEKKAAVRRKSAK